MPYSQEEDGTIMLNKHPEKFTNFRKVHRTPETENMRGKVTHKKQKKQERKRVFIKQLQGLNSPGCQENIKISYS